MISVVVPTYNEVGNIKNLLERLEKRLGPSPKAYEVVVIDDYSTDGTWDLLIKLKKKFPLRVFRKEGKKGKAYSLIEGFAKSSGNILAIIDADLQYPPEAIATMVSGLGDTCDIVVANRRDYKAPKFRKTFSKIFKFTFGKALHGIGCDVQSGLKVFKREVFETVKFTPKSAWSFDLEFLVRAKNAGFSVCEYDITFKKRVAGDSKISFLRNGWDLATNALVLKTKKTAPAAIKPEEGEAMKGAGVGFGGRKFITHTTLSHKKSAIVNFTFWQKTVLLGTLFLVSWGLFMDPLRAVATVVALLSTIYFLDVLFNLYLVLRSLQSPPEINFSAAEIAKVDDRKLPIYTILCPLYREARVLPDFLNAINAIDWPKEKLDVLLLLEADDTETIAVVDSLSLPPYFRKLVVPHSQPKTKPKACNWGLAHAKGEYVVIYDAEDIPDPQQLKKAYLAFSKSPREVICMQAKLNYFNPHQNLLTRLFTAEYSLWFDLSLTGMQSIDTAIPLGGTSNHFRTGDLRQLEGWDPFNVTEDADLGVRLFKAGYRTAIVDSTTLEEANSDIFNWIRQRSRWIKGYMQTYLVHMRNPMDFVRENGIHAFIFQLVVGGKIAFIFINPILWVATISYFVLNRLVGPTIEALYPSYIFYMAVISLVFGNFLFVYYYMVGCAKREQWSLMKYVFLVPFYWLAVSVAGVKALYQLIFKPHFWEKTVHGLHLEAEQLAAAVEEAEVAEVTGQEIGEGRIRKIVALATSDFGEGGMLIAATVVANFLNFLYNAYLGRALTVSDFGLISLVGSFLFLASIPISSLSRTVTHRSAYLLGKYGSSMKQFWTHTRSRALVVSAVTTVVWLLLTPLLATFFKAPNWDAFILFAPAWLITTLFAVDDGYLTGSLKFKLVSVLVVLEAAAKLAFTFLFVGLGYSRFVYAAIPLSTFVALLIAWRFASSLKESNVEVDNNQIIKFPTHFFVTSTFTKIAAVAFISFDLILAKHYLSPVEAGQYAMLSLVGKMIFLVGGLFSSFITPLVSRDEGAQKNSHKIFSKLLIASSTASVFAYLGVGLFGFLTVPILLGSKVEPIVAFLPLYGLAMLLFTVANTVITFHQTRGKHSFATLSLLLAALQVGGIVLFHKSILEIVDVMAVIGAGSFVLTLLLHFFYEPVENALKNVPDVLGIFSKLPRESLVGDGKRVLVFNWRDMRHVWAGGAEVYVHELSRRLIEKGYDVTVFCGNDRKSPRYEEIDGVKIIRRGGFYMVYVWAFLYYLFNLRKHADIVIDSENGIPFFTPLYIRKPIIGLVHHVHQEVFRRHLLYPFAKLAQFLEGTLMPLVYRNCQMITVSNSSKEDMEKLGFGKSLPIEVIYPGVDLSKFRPGSKTIKPSILYLGRLKPYKSIETAVYAMVKVIKDVPGAIFTIAGDGESKSSLERLVRVLGLEHAVKFVGKVPESEKAKLYASAWTMVQPSKMEGWGITAIEANACGTPVVASNVPGLRESVKNPTTGYLVPWGNHEMMADRIVTVLTDEKMRKHLETGSLEWSKQFSWNRSTDKLIEVLRESLQK